MQDRPALAWTRAFVRGLHCPLRLDVINKQASRRTGTGVRPARKRCRRVASHVPRHALGNERTAGILRIRPSGATGTFLVLWVVREQKAPLLPSWTTDFASSPNGHVMVRASRRGRRCRGGGTRRRRTPPPPPRRRTSRNPPRPRSRSGRRRSRGGRARPCG